MDKDNRVTWSLLFRGRPCCLSHFERSHTLQLPQRGPSEPSVQRTASSQPLASSNAYSAASVEAAAQQSTATPAAAPLTATSTRRAATSAPAAASAAAPAVAPAAVSAAATPVDDIAALALAGASQALVRGQGITLPAKWSAERSTQKPLAGRGMSRPPPQVA